MRPSDLSEEANKAVQEGYKANIQKAQEQELYNERKHLASLILSLTEHEDYLATPRYGAAQRSIGLFFGTANLQDIESRIYAVAEVTHMWSGWDATMYSPARLIFYATTADAHDSNVETIELKTNEGKLKVMKVKEESLPEYYNPLQPINELGAAKQIQEMKVVRESLNQLSHYFEPVNPNL